MQNRLISLLCKILDRTSIFPLQTNNHCPANDACLEHQRIEQVALKQRSEMFDLFSPVMVACIMAILRSLHAVLNGACEVTCVLGWTRKNESLLRGRQPCTEAYV